MITYGSVCSGIEAATVAWHPLGWRHEWFAEIEKFPSAVLAHHWPEVPNLGDMTKIAAMVRAEAVAAPDVLVGGTPCQAFSVAGARAGLADPRGQLTLAYVDLADAIDSTRALLGKQPVVTVWENVPGVLSSKDNAFGCFLGALAGESCELQPPGGKWKDAGCVFGPQRAIAWRVLDAQYFGVAQRRRRVFVVASARNGFDPAAVLFEREGVRRDTPPRRGPGQDTAGTLASRTGAGGFPGTDEACSGYVQPVGFEITGPVTACGGTAKKHGFGWGQQEWESGFAVPVSVHGTQDPDVRVDQAHTLGRNSGQENAVLSVALRGRDGGATAELGDDVAGCLRASSGGGDKPHVLAFQPGNLARGAGSGPSLDVFPTLKADHGRGMSDQDPHVMAGSAVRRLTPRECERLQAFPDDHTLIPYGRPVRMEKLEQDWIKYLLRGGVMTLEQVCQAAADGPRYKALGNSMCVFNMRWIGRRIQTHLFGN